jgi:PTH1 family peptidyl-tRNA hydrolase
MPIIVGLGNPGSEYDKTRHNIGFEVVDRIASEIGATFEAKGGPWQVANTRHKGNTLVLLKPTTYMNLSGQAVSKALRIFDIVPHDCMVITDDLNLPVGKLRIRKSGSDGGHNGLADIIGRIGTSDFPRMRIGVGNDFPKGRQADYVLSPFSTDERVLIDELIPKASEAALCFVREGTDAAMNRYNR